MSILQDLRTRGQHRGMTAWQLVQKIGRLERESDDRTCHLVELTTAVGELTAERDLLQQQLDAAGIEVSSCRLDCQELHDEVLRLRARLTPYLAAEANAQAVTVPPMVRDTTAIEDQATGPIDVRPLWEALGVGPVVDAADPAHVPSWVETQEIPIVDIPQKEVA